MKLGDEHFQKEFLKLLNVMAMSNQNMAELHESLVLKLVDIDAKLGLLVQMLNNGIVLEGNEDKPVRETSMVKGTDHALSLGYDGV